MNIGVVGSGRVGVVVGACLAEAGHRVICADIDEGKVRELQGGSIPFHEPALESLARRNAARDLLRFSTSVGCATEHADVLFVTVRAPAGDVEPLLSVAGLIGDHLHRPKTVIVKSTVPVGTTARMRAAVAGRADALFDMCYNPEFLRQGTAVEDFTRPERVVLGVERPEVRPLLEALYAPFVAEGAPLLFMDVASAELTKVVANAMLSTRVSFMNFVAELCEATGADVDLVRRGIGADHRIGADGLRPGPGFGGACLPQDLEALIQVSQAHGITADLLEAVRDINARQPLRILARVREMLDGRLDGRAIAVWGLAFKAGTDDIRESPAVRFIEGLLDAGAVVRAYDPRARWGAEQAFGERIRYSNDPYAVLDGADALVVMTEWEAFRAPDFDRVRKLLRLPVVVDARNLFEPSAMRRMGFRYAGVGRGGES